MKTVAIIAEYNPFHNGHKYHAEQSKKMAGADYCIAIISPNFVQRGEPAMLDKFSRAQMALQNGADLVLELPTVYATASAEYFAAGAVATLANAGVVDTLSFGSEIGTLTVLHEIADVLLEESDYFKEVLQHYMKAGYAYPAARIQAVIAQKPALTAYTDVFMASNNILAIEYLKALKRQNAAMEPMTIKRLGADYRDMHYTGQRQCSALAIRASVFSEAFTQKDWQGLSYQMPMDALELVQTAFENNRLLNADDFSAQLQYKLLLESEKGYEAYFDVSKDLSDKIKKHLYEFTTYHGFCDLLKSKEMTYTRISRCLLHILLAIKKEDVAAYQAAGIASYARILGFKKEAAPLLDALQEKSKLPIITKLSDGISTLEGTAKDMLLQEIACNRIYDAVLSRKAQTAMPNEFRRPLVLL